jgi:hypothetical protein
MKPGTFICFSIACALPLKAADSDPAKTPPPPQGSIGFADRSPSLDVLPGFKNPPAGFGIVPFFWWLGDPLTKERLSWQLEQMKGMGVSGYQINYAHSDKGGRSFGLSYPSEPALFSEAWWELVDWFKSEAGKQGAGISLSDYTLGFGQGYMVDGLLRDHPEVKGMELRMGKDGKVVPETLPWSLNPMHPMSGKWYAGRFFGQFEKRFPGEGGKGLNFFFSDELGFGVSGRMWSADFAEEFRKRKGYDIVPELTALFKDTGPRTPKLRLDYYDVLVALSEEGFFKPVFDWHQQRGMILGCDHGGRGMRVDEFGDYFRTQRWNQAPGADQPHLGKDLIKAKVAASIAHLYQRPRVWLEGFYGSGWGTTSAGLIDATFANYAMGFNLLGLHGMYYSTHGGWWEWAPPDNTFRMPYWKHLKGFMDCQQRLAYLLSQGHYRCDVAILYPVAAVEAGMDGRMAVDTAFKTAKDIYSKGIDFDFMDFQSLARAEVVGKELHVSGNIYKVLVLPAMKAVRHSTLQKAVEFKRTGGLVLSVGALPEASDRIGRGDPEVAAMVKELFPNGPTNDAASAIPFRDYIGPGYIQHRKIGPRDVYAIYNAPKGTEVFFRAKGSVELWDPWSGTTKPLAVISQNDEGTKLHLPLTNKEMQVIVFSPGTAQLASRSPVSNPKSTITLDGPWEFELKPTLDNQFGDFHWPPTKTLIGAEARRLKYADETSANPGWEKAAIDDSKWPLVTCGFGPRFWKLGPLPDTAEADAALASLKYVDPAKSVRIDGKDYSWQPYEFSWRYGIENDCAHQGYHGLKIQVADEFIAFGNIRHGHPACKRVAEAGGSRYYLWTSVQAQQAGVAGISTGGLLPAKAWLNGQALDVKAGSARLAAGGNPLLLRYDKTGRGWFIPSSQDNPETRHPNGAPQLEVLSDAGRNTNVLPWNVDLAMRWFKDPMRPVFDTRSQVARPAGWYRFIAPPGLRSLTLPVSGKPKVWADGKELVVSGSAGDWKAALAEPARSSSVVAIRVEQTRGDYGGAAFSDYIRLECGAGEATLGDWSNSGVLETYSGGAWYRKTFQLTAAQASSKVTLDLGEVAASAEVRVNGQSAGIMVTPPWRLDISAFAKPGENRLEVLVCNTLANHYVTIPTHYRGKTTSGLLGPVMLEISNQP